MWEGPDYAELSRFGPDQDRLLSPESILVRTGTLEAEWGFRVAWVLASSLTHRTTATFAAIAERLIALAPYFARRPQLRLVHQALQAIEAQEGEATAQRREARRPILRTGGRIRVRYCWAQ